MERSSELIETGDIHAEPGSRQWAAGLRTELWGMVDGADTNHEGFNLFLDTLRKYEGWSSLQSSKGKPYGSKVEFCLDRRPHGLGMTREQVGKWLKELEWVESTPARAEGAKPAGDTGRPKKGSDSPPLPKGSNSADRLTARIARDRPDVLERMKAGEFPSVRQAAIEAGIVKVPTPLDILRRAWAKASKAERLTFLDEVTRG